MTKSRIITANFTRKPYLSIVRCQGQLNDQTFQASLKGGFGVQYEIESTVDLVQWGPLTNLTTSFGTAQFSDPLGANLNKYYRAVPVPAPLGTNLVFIEPGTFTMGSPTNEAERSPLETQHTVTISRGFWMAKYLVTQRDYLAVVGSNPSFFCVSNGFSVILTCPVEQVSWYDASNYCALRMQQERAGGLIPSNYVYRLPTEAEWEYACRAGTTTAFYLGSGLHSGQANFDGQYEYDASVGTINNPSGVDLQMTTPVGSYAANPWGLYDMIGNVLEWCQDWYGAYPAGSVIDPQGPGAGSFRVHRGGNWRGIAGYCRSAFRSDFAFPGGRYDGIGFRVLLAPGQ
jgi:formylglycine-generating enzyme required for sulfatase activity